MFDVDNETSSAMISASSIAFLFTACLIASIRAESDCMRHVVIATGVGRRSYKTSVAMIQLGVQETGPTARDVQAEVAGSSSKLMDFLKSQHVNKLQTTAVSLYPTYDYRSNPRKLTGYSGSNTVSFEVPIARAGMLLDASVRHGATMVQSLSFRASSLVSTNARRYAIRDAVIRARIEARTAVFSLGRVLGNPVFVKVTDSYIPRPVSAPTMTGSFALARTDGAHTQPTTPIVASVQTVRAYVTVTFATY